MSLNTPLQKSRSVVDGRTHHTPVQDARLVMIMRIDRLYKTNSNRFVHISPEGAVILDGQLFGLLAMTIAGVTLLSPVYLLCSIALATRDVNWNDRRSVVAYMLFLLSSTSSVSAYCLSAYMLLFRTHHGDLHGAHHVSIEMFASFGIGFVLGCILAVDILYIWIAESVGESGLASFMTGLGNGGHGVKMLNPDLVLHYMKLAKCFRTACKRPLVPTYSFQDQFHVQLEDIKSADADTGEEIRMQKHWGFDLDVKLLYCNHGFGNRNGYKNRFWIFFIAAAQAFLPMVCRGSRGTDVVHEDLLIASVQILYVVVAWSTMVFFFSNFLDAIDVLNLHKMGLELVIFHSTISERRTPGMQTTDADGFVALELDSLLMKPRCLGDDERLNKIFTQTFGGPLKTVSVKSFLIIRKLHMLENSILRVLSQFRFAGIFGGALSFIIFAMVNLSQSHSLTDVSFALAALDILGLLGCSYCLFSKVVCVNGIISDTTEGIFLGWKEKLYFMRWAAQDAFNNNDYGSMSVQRGALDNYFRGLIEPFDVMFQYLGRQQIPMSFFSVPLTAGLQKKVIAVASPFVFTMTLNFIKTSPWVKQFVDGF